MLQWLPTARATNKRLSFSIVTDRWRDNHLRYNSSDEKADAKTHCDMCGIGFAIINKANVAHVSTVYSQGKVKKQALCDLCYLVSHTDVASADNIVIKCPQVKMSATHFALTILSLHAKAKLGGEKESEQLQQWIALAYRTQHYYGLPEKISAFIQQLKASYYYEQLVQVNQLWLQTRSRLEQADQQDLIDPQCGIIEKHHIVDLLQPGVRIDEHTRHYNQDELAGLRRNTARHYAQHTVQTQQFVQQCLVRDAVVQTQTTINQTLKALYQNDKVHYQLFTMAIQLGKDLRLSDLKQCYHAQFTEILHSFEHDINETEQALDASLQTQFHQSELANDNIVAIEQQYDLLNRYRQQVTQLVDYCEQIVSTDTDVDRGALVAIANQLEQIQTHISTSEQHYNTIVATLSRYLDSHSRSKATASDHIATLKRLRQQSQAVMKEIDTYANAYQRMAQVFHLFSGLITLLLRDEDRRLLTLLCKAEALPKLDPTIKSTLNELQAQIVQLCLGDSDRLRVEAIEKSSMQFSELITQKGILVPLLKQIQHYIDTRYRKLNQRRQSGHVKKYINELNTMLDSSAWLKIHHPAFITITRSLRLLLMQITHDDYMTAYTWWTFDHFNVYVYEKRLDLYQALFQAEIAPKLAGIYLLPLNASGEFDKAIDYLSGTIVKNRRNDVESDDIEIPESVGHE